MGLTRIAAALLLGVASLSYAKGEDKPAAEAAEAAKPEEKPKPAYHMDYMTYKELAELVESIGSEAPRERVCERLTDGQKVHFREVLRLRAMTLDEQLSYLLSRRDLDDDLVKQLFKDLGAKKLKRAYIVARKVRNIKEATPEKQAELLKLRAGERDHNLAIKVYNFTEKSSLKEQVEFITGRRGAKRRALLKRVFKALKGEKARKLLDDAIEFHSLRTFDDMYIFAFTRNEDVRKALLGSLPDLKVNGELGEMYLTKQKLFSFFRDSRIDTAFDQGVLMKRWSMENQLKYLLTLKKRDEIYSWFSGLTKDEALKIPPAYEPNGRLKAEKDLTAILQKYERTLKGVREAPDLVSKAALIEKNLKEQPLAAAEAKEWMLRLLAKDKEYNETASKLRKALAFRALTKEEQAQKYLSLEGAEQAKLLEYVPDVPTARLFTEPEYTLGIMARDYADGLTPEQREKEIEKYTNNTTMSQRERERMLLALRESKIAHTMDKAAATATPKRTRKRGGSSLTLSEGEDGTTKRVSRSRSKQSFSSSSSSADEDDDDDN